MPEENKHGMYTLAIVAIIAIVSLVVMINGAKKTTSSSLSNEDVAGQAYEHTCSPYIIGYKGEAILLTTLPSGPDNTLGCQRLSGANNNPFQKGSIKRTYTDLSNYRTSVQTLTDNGGFNPNSNRYDLSDYSCAPDNIGYLYRHYVCTEGVIDGACKRIPIYSYDCSGTKKKLSI